MKRKAVAPPSIFDSKPYGFSQGVVVEGGKKMLFISGQLAANKDGKFVGGSFEQQCRMALAGLGAVLAEARTTKKNVVKITAYVTDMKGSLEEFVVQTKKYFKGGYPASTLVEVKALAFPGQVVEIEAIAVV
jgi:enamine deaminase RidA (YjgF/YER057c/UK114 family)